MNILIVEDEPHAAKHLRETIASCDSRAVFYPEIDNVEDVIAFLQSSRPVDLIFMDIHLSDGQAFEIFDVVKTNLPVIFTTAYDEYAIKAFEVNSIDYLLKPITKERVQKALTKFQSKNEGIPLLLHNADIRKLQTLLAETRVYKESFLVPFKDKLLPVPVSDFAWFEIKNGVVIGTQFSKTSVVLEERSLEELIAVINPRKFCRANRQYLINKDAIKELTHYFNGKLLLQLNPAPNQQITVSRERATNFKNWLSS